jgi:leucyl aminopeptidase
MSIKTPQVELKELGSLDLKKYSIFVIPVSSKDGKAHLQNQNFKKAVEKEFDLSLQDQLENWPDFVGKSGEIIEVPISKKGYLVSRIYLAGVGEEKREDFKKAAAAIARKVKGNGQNVALAIVNDISCVANVVMALILASFVWNMKTPKKDEKGFSSFTLVARSDVKPEFERGKVLALGAWQARELVHTPSNIKNPKWLSEEAKKIVFEEKNINLKINVKSPGQLKEFGGLLAVGNSSPKNGPYFVEISYTPKGSRNIPHVVLVGKGITFDTGGVSLKRPYDIMAPMKSDMSGAAAVLATLVTVARLGAKVKVTGLMMCAENALSSTSQRPSDVITHFGGTTVEVIDTDAEGRLVLADGLAYADEKLNPDYLIDIATLTGSATLGLGRQYGAMYTRNEKLAKKLHEVGNRIGERVWHMPLIDDYKSALESDIADFNHTADKEKFSAGSVTAALFLEHFAGEIGKQNNWVHLDIAGVARSEGETGENPKGGTGFGVRLLSEWIASL